MQTTPAAWLPAPADLRLLPGEVHIWRLELDLPAARQAALSALLSLDEQRRCAAFRTTQLQQRFSAAHGWLRLLLSRYLACDPAALAFTANPWGKPSLAAPAPGKGGDGEGRICFNLTHSASLALLAVARDARLGIDLEVPRPGVETEALWQRYFSSAEQAALVQLPLGLHERAFYAVWTRKEAYMKAVGKGLAIPLDSFTVSVHPEEPALLLQAADEDLGVWTLQDLLPAAGCPACAAIDRPVTAWRCWTV